MDNSLIQIQREYNHTFSLALNHMLAHPLYGKRRYRRGYGRCKVCGGFLSPHEVTILEMEKMSGISDVLRGPSLVKTVSSVQQSLLDRLIVGGRADVLGRFDPLIGLRRTGSWRVHES